MTHINFGLTLTSTFGLVGYECKKSVSNISFLLYGLGMNTFLCQYTFYTYYSYQESKKKEFSHDAMLSVSAYRIRDSISRFEYCENTEMLTLGPPESNCSATELQFEDE